MRLSLHCVGIEVRAGLTRLLDPPAAILRLHYRALPPVRLGPPVRSKTRPSGIGQKKRSPGRPRVRRIIESVRGARNRPRNKSVLAQSENELNHNFAGGNEFCLTY